MVGRHLFIVHSQLPLPSSPLLLPSSNKPGSSTNYI